MKKILLFVSVLTLAAACVDQDFDLDKIDDSDFALGNDNSEFMLPLANITVLTNALESASTVEPLRGMFVEADEWLPSSYDKLDFALLSSESGRDDYLQKIIDDLFVEFQADNAKCETVAARIEESYYSNIDIPAEYGTDIHAYVIENLKNNSTYNEKIKQQVTDLASAHLDALYSVEPVETELDGLDIDESVIDALTGEGSKLEIYGTIDNYVPFDCKGTLVIKSSDQTDSSDDYYDYGYYFDPVEIEINLDYHKTATELRRVEITRDVLNGLSRGATLSVSFMPSAYYPRQTLPEDNKAAMKMTLKLYKKGGLNISDL